MKIEDGTILSGSESKIVAIDIPRMRTRCSRRCKRFDFSPRHWKQKGIHTVQTCIYIIYNMIYHIIYYIIYILLSRLGLEKLAGSLYMFPFLPCLALRAGYTAIRHLWRLFHCCGNSKFKAGIGDVHLAVSVHIARRKMRMSQLSIKKTGCFMFFL